jgi:hypothetical protein
MRARLVSDRSGVRGGIGAELIWAVCDVWAVGH